MSEATVEVDRRDARLEVADLRATLRQTIRRKIDLVMTLAAGGVGILQVIALESGGSVQQLAALAVTLSIVLCGLLGLSGRATWTPAAYVAMVGGGNVAYLTTYGPLIGMGAAYLCIATVAFLFLSPTWRWIIVAVFAATVLAVGASCALGVVDLAPTVRLDDARAWTRTGLVTVGSMTAIAWMIRYCVRQLVVARTTLERALERARAARHEQVQFDQEISRVRHADLVVELAADVGADIGAALRIISTQAEALARELTDEEAQLCLADVLAAASAAGSTMRSLTVLGSNVVHAEPGSDAARTARELPRIVRRVVPARIALGISAVDEAWVSVSAIDLARILSNLVLNARDAISDVGEIYVKVSSAAPSVVIEVRDNGVGMDPATQAKLFQPFFTTKPIGRGTGLGLASTKILVERAGGTIEFVSQQGIGTCFTIRLPLISPPTSGDGNG